MSLYRSNVSHSVDTMVEMAGVPRPKSGAGHRVGDPKKSAEFCCTCFKTQRVMLNVKGLDVGT